MDFSEDREDLFKKAGFGNYEQFLKEINAVATALEKDFKDDTLFKEFQEKLKKITGPFCIKNDEDLYNVLGKPVEMKENYDQGAFKGPRFQLVVRKLNEGVTSCLGWTPSRIDVNPNVPRKLSPGMSDTSSCVSSSSPSSSGTWEEYNDFLNKYYKDHIPYYINNGIVLDFLTFYFRKKCLLLIKDLKRNIILLQLISEKINKGSNIYNYELLKHVINSQIELLRICESDKEVMPPPPPPKINPPSKPQGRKCIVIKLKQPIRVVYLELLSGLRSLLGLDGSTPKLRTLELEKQFPGLNIFDGNSYTKLANSIAYGNKKYPSDASLEAHTGVAKYYMNKIKDCATELGIDINDPNLNQQIGKIICSRDKKLEEYRQIKVEVDC